MWRGGLWAGSGPESCFMWTGECLTNIRRNEVIAYEGPDFWLGSANPKARQPWATGPRGSLDGGLPGGGREGLRSSFPFLVFGLKTPPAPTGSKSCSYCTDGETESREGKGLAASHRAGRDQTLVLGWLPSLLLPPAPRLLWGKQGCFQTLGDPVGVCGCRCRHRAVRAVMGHGAQAGPADQAGWCPWEHPGPTPAPATSTTSWAS